MTMILHDATDGHHLDNAQTSSTTLCMVIGTPWWWRLASSAMMRYTVLGSFDSDQFRDFIVEQVVHQNSHSFSI